MKICCCIIFLSFCSYAHAATLAQLDAQMTFGNHYQYDLDTNYALVNHASKEIQRDRGGDLSRRVSLLLKCGNVCYNCEEPIRALTFYEQILSLLGDEPDLLQLASVDRQLPALYASTLYQLSRLTFCTRPKDSDCTEALDYCNRAIAAVELIDKHGLPQFTAEEKKQSFSSRDLYRLWQAAILNEQQEYAAACNVLEEVAVNDYTIMQLLKQKAYFRVYFKWAKSLENPLAAKRYYDLSYDAIEKLIAVLAADENKVAKRGALFCEIAEFYCDRDNPYFDLAVAAKYFDEAEQACSDQYKRLSYIIADGKSLLYKEKARKYRSQYLESDAFLGLGVNELSNNIYYTCFQRLQEMHVETGKFYESQVLSDYRNRIAPESQSLRQDIVRKFFSHHALSTEKRDFLCQRMDAYEAKLQSLRDTIPKELERQSPLEICQYVSKEQRGFLSIIFADVLAALSLDDAHVELVVFGSLASNTATPYSDIECLILTDLSTDSPRYPSYTKAAELLGIILAAFRETPVKECFPDHSFVEQLAIHQGMRLDPGLFRWQKGVFHIPVVNISSITGYGFSVCDGVKKNMFYSLHAAGKENFLPEFRNRIRSSVNHHDIVSCSVLFFTHSHPYNALFPQPSVSYDYYRPAIELIRSLAYLNGIECVDIQEQIERLGSDQVISTEFQRLLLLHFNYCSALRLNSFESLNELDYDDGDAREIIKALCYRCHTQLKHKSDFDRACEKLDQGWALLADNQNGEAQQGFIEAAEVLGKYYPWKNPFFAEALLGQGVCAFQSGSYHQAQNHLEHALAIYRFCKRHPSEKGVLACRYLCRTYAILGEHEKADEQMEQLMNVVPLE